MSQVAETVLDGREVIYPIVEVTIFDSAEDNKFGDEEARHLLGWTEPEENTTFDKFHFRDLDKKPVFCSNKILQRPLYMTRVKELMYEILARNWQFNLETIIVGCSGAVLDGQHRLIALVLAVQEYHRNPDRYPAWDEPPYIDVIVALGAKESKEIVNTIGTGKPRSLADSFYASGVFDIEDNPKDLKQLCRMAEHSVRLLWLRTGAGLDNYNTKYSHSDALKFLENHATLMDYTKTLYEENDGKHKKIEKFSGAYAPALFYLMATSATNPESYRKAYTRTEEILDFSREELAERYWMLLASEDKSVEAVTKAINALSAEGNYKENERVAILIKGWNVFVDESKDKITDKDVKLDVKLNDFGSRILLEDPTVGGIDLGYSDPEV